MIRALAAALLVLGVAVPARAVAPPAERDVSDAAVRDAIRDGIAFLLRSRNPDGSWGGVRNATFTSSFASPSTYDCWQVGTTALATLALMEAGSGPDADAAVAGGLDYLMAHAVLKRPAEWDVDNVWGIIYALNTVSRALKDPRYRDSDRAQALRAAGRTLLRGMARYQGPRGGWGYYANPGSAWLPEWATSFTTSAGVIALVEAKEAGLAVPDKVLRGAVRAVERCRLPNGAYSYSVEAIPRPLRMESIDQVKGSLGRIQVGNYALHRAGVHLPEGAMETGLERFFRYHRFLDAARNKPIPHEAYYANAAYFYLFGHYYASQVLETLPAERRREWTPRLRREILKCQQKDGAFWDFWIASMTKPYGTAFAVLALRGTQEGARPASSR